jgi:hypothetical protein
MATWEQELGALKARVERLEITVRRLAGNDRQLAPPTPDQVPDQQQLLDRLKAEGLIRDPTPEEQRLAAEWDALPEEEKQAHVRFMRSLALDPPLSQVIIENRLPFYVPLSTRPTPCVRSFLTSKASR